MLVCFALWYHGYYNTVKWLNMGGYFLRCLYVVHDAVRKRAKFVYCEVDILWQRVHVAIIGLVCGKHSKGCCFEEHVGPTLL